MLKQLRERLLAQGCKATDMDGNCRYKGGNDTQCAVGMFITDEEYDKDMERCANLEALQQDYPKLALWDIAPMGVWNEVQGVHDRAPDTAHRFRKHINAGFNRLDNIYGTTPTVSQEHPS